MNAQLLERTITTSTGKKVQVSLTKGDIARSRADAMITAINSGGAWFGGIDGVISKNCGAQYHDQAAAAMPLKDKQVIVAKKKRPTTAMFEDVIFVVDDLKSPLSQIVQEGLAGANEVGFTTVSLPAIRTGVFAGLNESLEEAVIQLHRGIDQHVEIYPDTRLNRIEFVIYNDGPILTAMENAMKPLAA